MKELNDRATDLSQEYQNQENVTQLIQQYDANEAVLLDLQNRVSALENAQG